MARPNAEQCSEGGMGCAASVEAEDELVEVGLEMLAAQAVIDAESPGLEVGKDAVDPGQDDVGAMVPTTWGSWAKPGRPG